MLRTRCRLLCASVVDQVALLLQRDVKFDLATIRVELEVSRRLRTRSPCITAPSAVESFAGEYPTHRIHTLAVGLTRRKTLMELLGIVNDGVRSALVERNSATKR